MHQWSEQRRARGTYECFLCNLAIRRGELHEVTTLLDDGWWRTRAHTCCYPAAAALELTDPWDGSVAIGALQAHADELVWAEVLRLHRAGIVEGFIAAARGRVILALTSAKMELGLALGVADVAVPTPTPGVGWVLHTAIDEEPADLQVEDGVLVARLEGRPPLPASNIVGIWRRR